MEGYYSCHGNKRRLRIVSTPHVHLRSDRMSSLDANSFQSVLVLKWESKSCNLLSIPSQYNLFCYCCCCLT